MCHYEGMQKRASRPDLNELAKPTVEPATGVPPVAEDMPDEGKNPHAAALGRLGGKKGGLARAAKLTPKQRQEIARKAANTRWSRTPRG